MPGGLAGIMAGEAFVKITPDLSGVVEKVQETGEKAAKSFADKMAGVEKVGSTLTKFVTLPLAGVGAVAFKTASDLNESISKVDVVFEHNKGIQNWAKDAAVNLGLSRQQALEAAGTFGNLFRAMGIGTPVAVGMSESLIELSADLASFNNADPTEVLEALRAGLVGETEPLRRFGVNINQARIEAEAFALGLAKPAQNATAIKEAHLGVEKAIAGVAKAMKEHGKASIEARQAQVDLEQAQEKLNKATAGSKVELDAAAKAQATYSLIQKDTALAQGDFERTSKGAANQMRILKAQAMDAAASFGQVLLPIGQKILGMLNGVAKAIMGVSPGMRTAIVVIGGLVAAVGPALLIMAKLVTAFNTINTAVKALNLTMGLTRNLLLVAAPWVAAAVALGAAVYLIAKHWDAIKRIFQDAIDWIKGLLTAAWGEDLIALVMHPFQTIKRLWDDFWATFFDPDITSAGLFGIVEQFAKWASQVWGTVVDVGKRILGWLADLPGNMAYWAGYAVGAFLRFWWDLPGNLWDVLTETLRRFADFAADTARWVAYWGPSLLASFGEWLAKLPGRVWDFLSQIPGVIGRASVDAFNAAKDFGAKVLDGAVTFIKELPSRMKDIASNVIEAIKDLARAAFNAMKDWAGNLWKGFKAGLGISSPSFIERAMSGIVRNVNGSVSDLETSVGRVGNIAIPGVTAGGVTAAAMAGGGSQTVIQLQVDGETLTRVVYDGLRRRELQQGPLFQGA